MKITIADLLNAETKNYSIKTIDLLNDTEGDVRILVKAWEYELAVQITFNLLEDAKHFTRVAFDNECVSLPIPKD